MRLAFNANDGEPMNELPLCNRLLQIRVPAFMTRALDNAADKRLTSRSDYVRVALLDRLRADGIDPAQLVKTVDA